MDDENRIVRVTAHEVVVPVKPGSTSSAEWEEDHAGIWYRQPICLLEVEMGDGLVALGEMDRGHTLDRLRPLLAALPGAAMRGFSVDPWPAAIVAQARPDRLVRQPILHGAARAPLSLALESVALDAMGKRLGCRAVDLLGGAYRERAPVHYWCFRQKPEDLRRTVRRAKEAGFKGIKTKARAGDPVLEQVQAVKDEVGRDFLLTIDFNDQWLSPRDCLFAFQELEKIGHAVQVENPFPRTDIESWRRVRSASSVPLVFHVDQDHTLRYALKHEMADGFNCGVHSALTFLELAGAVGVMGYSCWHGSGVELGVTQALRLHAAAAARCCTMANDLISGFVRQHTLVTWDWPYLDGELPLPTGHGLGVELDRDALERFVRLRAVFE